MAHYFTEKPVTKSNPIYFESKVLDITLKINSDSGVFSSKYIDFGSKVLMKSFIKTDSYKKILDMGCGYGGIGIFLKKFFSNSSVDMVDINERAIELAKKNIIANDVECNAFKSDGFNEVKQKYDLICLNPPIRAGKKIYYKMYNDAKEHLNPGGEFRIVIQKKQGALSSKEELTKIFGNCELVCREKGYQIYKSILTIK